MTTSRLRRPMSASISTTLCPSWASPVPRLAVAVVLPTPPLPEVMTMARPMKFLLSGGGDQAARKSSLVPLDHDGAAGGVGDLGPLTGGVRLSCPRHQATDAQLLRLETKREDEP